MRIQEVIRCQKEQRIVKISPQFRLSIGLVTMLLSTVLIADFIDLLPKPDSHVRDSRISIGESLAVQLSTAITYKRPRIVQETIREVVTRNEKINFAGLYRADGSEVSSFGKEQQSNDTWLDFSSLNNLIVPINSENTNWGEVRLQFAPTNDWGMRYLGFPARTLEFILFLGLTCLATFYLVMRRALSELNPTKVVPQRVNAAFDVLAESVVILDDKLQIVLANKSFIDRIGIAHDHIIGRKISTFDWDLKGDEVEVLPWHAALERNEHIKGMPLKLATDTEQVVFAVNAAPIAGGQGDHRGVLITMDDVTPLEAKNSELARMLAQLSETQSIIEKKNEELEVLATRDPLTGCLNRRSFMALYEGHFNAATASQTQSIVVMMADIDHFKKVNDQFGHGVGDEAIKLVASTFMRTFRQQDAVARYGGEEFVAAIPDVSLDQAEKIAERIRTLVAKRLAQSQLPLDHLTISIGLAAYHSEISDPATLLDQADRALYQAKETGRDRICRFNPEYVQNPKRSQEPSGIGEQSNIVAGLRSKLNEMQSIVQNQARELTHQAMHDDLTGLPNRFLLLDRLTQAMKLSERNESLTAIISISLSAYQNVKDLSSSESADQMLQQASARLEKVVRSVDTIGVAFNDQALTLSRIAHNELALLVVDLDGVESIPKIASRITRALEAPFTIGAHEYANKIHCGIAVFPNDGNEADSLVRNASLARNHAERRSETTSGQAYFSREIDNLSIKNAKIATELSSAIRNDGLQIVYQPKVHSKSKKVTGVEALVRWNHPELGQVGPMEFVTVAEHIGVVDQLTNWVLRRVCENIKQGLLGDLRVSVNVSPLELCDPTTGDRLLKIIKECNIPSERIEVEITESSVLNNFELARSILSQLQATGVQVALDDFGTAYSSLNLLLEIPVDVIKIDRSFITDIQTAPNNQAVVGAIIQMAHSMHKTVVAEGVEQYSECDCLATLGCEEIQGYFFSKPLSVEDLVLYIGEHGTVSYKQDIANKIAQLPSRNKRASR